MSPGAQASRHDAPPSRIQPLSVEAEADRRDGLHIARAHSMRCPLWERRPPEPGRALSGRVAFFRDAFKSRRCIIPGQWLLRVKKTPEGKVPYAILPAQQLAAWSSSSASDGARRRIAHRAHAYIHQSTSSVRLPVSCRAMVIAKMAVISFMACPSG
jgi:hypothetical protein